MQLINNLKNLRITVRACLVLTFTFLLFHSISQGQTNATISTYHWANEYIHQLRLRGYLSDLNTIQEPYIEKDVLHSLIQLQNKIQQGKIIPTQQDKYLIDYLVNGFQLKRQSKSLIYEAGIWADESVLKDKDDSRFYTQLRSQVGGIYRVGLFMIYEFQFAIGRDFLNWDSGKTGRLLFMIESRRLIILQ